MAWLKGPISIIMLRAVFSPYITGSTHQARVEMSHLLLRWIKRQLSLLEGLATYNEIWGRARKPTWKIPQYTLVLTTMNCSKFWCTIVHYSNYDTSWIYTVFCVYTFNYTQLQWTDRLHSVVGYTLIFTMVSFQNTRNLTTVYPTCSIL